MQPPTKSYNCLGVAVVDTTQMVRYDGLLNATHSLNFSGLTHPTGLK
ncbi:MULTISPECIES: hypothetical protein [Okeania]|nr:hypothetical protein [Okeania sp. SIO1H4]NET77242.1 hypothetical protein [Okeania sp. SIO1F9]